MAPNTAMRAGPPGTGAGPHPGPTEFALSDDDLDAVVGGIRQPRGPVKLKALAHRMAAQASLSSPATVQLSTEVHHD